MKRLGLVLLMACAVPVQAQSYDVGLYLARLFVSEAGMQSERDHRAIFHALRNRARARDVPFARHMAEYSWPLFRPQTDRALMISTLEVDGSRPRLWPAGMEWNRHRGRWLDVIARARLYLEEVPENPCNGEPEHWGGRVTVDRERAKRAVGRGQWRPLDCGATRNTFFEVDR